MTAIQRQRDADFGGYQSHLLAEGHPLSQSGVSRMRCITRRTMHSHATQSHGTEETDRGVEAFKCGAARRMETNKPPTRIEMISPRIREEC